ncbi:MAG TPA: S9 family peptidase [Nocardioides sp.]|jgi:oligopeptidase B|nr:S9 family peptidase [Nocardioides sp.]
MTSPAADEDQTGTQPNSRPDAPPLAEPRPVTTEHHGRTRTDEYDWLRAKGTPEVTAYLEAENAWTAAATDHLAGLRETIFDEIRSRTKETDLSVPTRNRGWWYYGRSFEGREYGTSCRVPLLDPEDWTPPSPDEDAGPDEPALPGEQVLLDHDALADGHDFYSVGGVTVSPDANLLAFSTDTVGDERYVLQVKDLTTGELLPDRIEGVLGGGVWSPDGRDLYYCTVDEAWRRDKVWRHRVGSDEADELVFHETDERFWVGIGRSRTHRFLVIVTSSKNTSESRYLDCADPDADWVVFHPREEGLQYHLEHAVIAGEDRFLVLHDNAGPDFELGWTPIAATPPSGWTPLITHDEQVRLEDVSAYAGHLVVHQRSGGLTQLRIIELGDDGPGEDYLMEFPQELYTVGASGGAQFDQPVVRLHYTSLTVPASVYDYDVRSRDLMLRKRQPVHGHDPSAYEEHRLWATAEDGARIPVSVVCRAGARGPVGDEHPIPFLLYGYGAYEISVDPTFSVSRLSLLDRGAGVAIAHIRGGGEMGRRWYDDGRLSHKRNTFSDFAAAARHLVDTGWTAPDVLLAEGGSAGGLLIGVVANEHPDLFGGGLVAEVPFVDALTSMLDASLPLTVAEYEEWGNPEADAATYDYLAGYAPYDNVDGRAYPPILVTTSVNDTRVLYVEPAKWVARLRATAPGADRRPDILLKTEMSAGHGGVSGRYRGWRERAFVLAWVLDRMGLAATA